MTDNAKKLNKAAVLALLKEEVPQGLTLTVRGRPPRQFIEGGEGKGYLRAAFTVYGRGWGRPDSPSEIAARLDVELRKYKADRAAKKKRWEESQAADKAAREDAQRYAEAVLIPLLGTPAKIDMGLGDGSREWTWQIGMLWVRYTRGHDLRVDCDQRDVGPQVLWEKLAGTAIQIQALPGQRVSNGGSAQ